MTSARFAFQIDFRTGECTSCSASTESQPQWFLECVPLERVPSSDEWISFFEEAVLVLQRLSAEVHQSPVEPDKPVFTPKGALLREELDLIVFRHFGLSLA